MAGIRLTATTFLSALVLALTLTTSTAAQAQAPGEGGALNYSGVSIQGGDPPAPKAPPSGFQYVNWPGFRAGKGGNPTEVFLQLSGPVRFVVKQRGRSVQVVLEGVQVYLRNNLRPMITEHFPNQPVRRFRLRQLRGNRLALEITLRRPVKASAMVKTVGQYTYLVVALPG